MNKIINIALAQGLVQCGPGTSVPECGKQELFKLVYTLINFGLDIAALLAVMFVMWGGFLMLTAGGSEDKISQGKSAATSAVMGLFLVLISWLIVNTIITWFTNCTGNWSVFGGLKC
jgi:hypothetical protein